MIKISNINFSTTRYVLQKQYMHWCKKNISRLMLGHPDFNKISIGSYKQDILLTFMLAYRI